VLRGKHQQVVQHQARSVSARTEYRSLRAKARKESRLSEKLQVGVDRLREPTTLMRFRCDGGGSTSNPKVTRAWEKSTLRNLVAYYAHHVTAVAKSSIGRVVRNNPSDVNELKKGTAAAESSGKRKGKGVKAVKSKKVIRKGRERSKASVKSGSKAVGTRKASRKGMKGTVEAKIGSRKGKSKRPSKEVKKDSKKVKKDSKQVKEDSRKLKKDAKNIKEGSRKVKEDSRKLKKGTAKNKSGTIKVKKKKGTAKAKMGTRKGKSKSGSRKVKKTKGTAAKMKDRKGKSSNAA